MNLPLYFFIVLLALTYTKDLKYHGKTKYIRVHYHYICDMAAQDEVVLKHVSTREMVADPLTKPIVRDVFLSHIRGMKLCKI